MTDFYPTAAGGMYSDSCSYVGYLVGSPAEVNAHVPPGGTYRASIISLSHTFLHVYHVPLGRPASRFGVPRGWGLLPIVEGLRPFRKPIPK